MTSYGTSAGGRASEGGVASFACHPARLQYLTQALQYATVAYVTRPSPQTDRVVALIGLLAAGQDRSLTLAELTRRLNVNKSTCYSMLVALVEAGWLLRDPRRKTYRLGPALIGIGRQAAAGFPALEFAREVLAQLSLELRLHCAAIATDGDSATVLDQVQDPAARGVGLPIGQSYPLRPPFGAGVVAWSGQGDIDRWLSHAAPDRHEEYRSALEAIRCRGFTVELAPASGSGYRRLLAELQQRSRTNVNDGRSAEELLLELVELADQERYLAGELELDALYPVNDLNAPVFNEDRTPGMVLAVSGFTRPLRGSEVLAMGRRLLSATNELTRALGGMMPDQAAERPLSIRG